MSRRFDVSNPDVRELVISECSRVLSDDGLIVLPTDTVYGIAADAFSAPAVSKLLAAKGRGRDMPPPVLVGRKETLFGIAEAVDQAIVELTSRFWPGPLTIICNAQPTLDWDLGDTHGTVAVRMPADDIACEVLRATGPLAVSSANTSGQPAATNAADAQEMLGEAVDIYLSSGAASGGVSSTIIDMTSQPPRIVRSGPISYSELNEVVPDLLDLAEPASTTGEG